MDVQVSKPGGSSFRLSSIGITVQDFRVSSPSVIPQYGTREGSMGRIDYGATLESRTITVPFFFKTEEMHGVAHVRDALYDHLIDVDSFYVREMRRRVAERGSDVFVNGKRYKVRVSDVIEAPEQVDGSSIGFGEIVFETTELPLAESVSNTVWIDSNGIPTSWHGMGDLKPGETYSYRFPVVGQGGSSEAFVLPFFPIADNNTTGKFRIYNGGTHEVHPFEQELVITIENVEGSTSYVEVRNDTNGSRFRYNEAVSPSAKIVINGASITYNGLQALRKTSREYIELNSGWNTFTLRGADKAFLTFNFRYYYK